VKRMLLLVAAALILQAVGFFVIATAAHAGESSNAPSAASTR
jgi:hypothetical protein